ncbi:MAG: hypothetical protein ACXAC6_06600 [Candidatus Hodarchaeales archaeon]|jgi:hypothetical protein
MTKLNTQYDEKSPKYEDDTWAIPLKLFSQDASLFSDFPELTTPEFVEEVFVHKKELDKNGFQWVDIIAVNDSKSKQELFKEYFSQENPLRIFRLEIEFYLSFHNWVDPTKSFPEMQIRLKEQVDALSLVADWYDKGKVEITNTDNSPALLYFLVTPDIFNKVLANPGIGYTLNPNQVATLAQDHYFDETANSFKKYEQN